MKPVGSSTSTRMVHITTLRMCLTPARGPGTAHLERLGEAVGGGSALAEQAQQLQAQLQACWGGGVGGPGGLWGLVDVHDRHTLWSMVSRSQEHSRQPRQVLKACRPLPVQHSMPRLPCDM